MSLHSLILAQAGPSKVGIPDPYVSKVVHLLNMDSLPFTDAVGNTVQNTNVTLAAPLHGGDHSGLFGAGRGLKLLRAALLGNAKFTLECTIEKTASGMMVLFSSESYNNSEWYIVIEDSRIYIYGYASESYRGYVNVLFSFKLNTRYHLVFEKKTTGSWASFNFYINGVCYPGVGIEFPSQQAFIPLNFPNGNLFVGKHYSNSVPFVGRIDNVRITDGVMRYNGVNFVPDFETPYTLD